MNVELIKNIARRVTEEAATKEPRSLEEVVREALVTYELERHGALPELDCMTPERIGQLVGAVTARRNAGASDNSTFALALREMECLLNVLRQQADKLRHASAIVLGGVGMNHLAIGQQNQGALGRDR